jgi:hypothetical protein
MISRGVLSLKFGVTNTRCKGGYRRISGNHLGRKGPCYPTKTFGTTSPSTPSYDTTQAKGFSINANGEIKRKSGPPLLIMPGFLQVGATPQIFGSTPSVALVSIKVRGDRRSRA